MSLLKKYQIELAVFFVLMVELAVKIPVMDLSHSDISFHLFHYLADYKIAFVGRSLAGTLIHLFSGAFLSAKFVWFFIFVHIILLSLLVSWACGRIIKNADEKYKPFAAYAVIFYLASPVSPAYLFYIGNYGRPDLYMAICLLLIVFLLKPLPKPAVRISRIIFIPILCFCLIAFHVYGLAFYFPTIFLILAYNLYQDRKASTLVLLLAAVLVSTGFGLYFLGPGKDASTFIYLNDTYTVPRQDTDIVLISWDTDNPSTAFPTIFPFYSVIPSFFKILANAFLTIILLSPFFALIGYFFKKVVEFEKDKVKKFIFALLAVPFWVLLVFVLQPDWGRYFSFVTLSWFVVIFYFFNAKQASFLYAADKVYELCKKNSFLFFILIIYLLILGRYPHWIKFPIIANIKEIVLYLLH